MKCYIKEISSDRNKIYFNDENEELFIRKMIKPHTKGQITRYTTTRLDTKNINELEKNEVLETLIEILDQKHELVFEKNNNVSRQSCKLDTKQDTMLFYLSIDNSDYEESVIKQCCMKNNKIYTTLLWELIHYFYYTNKESYTTAFLHLYRILEYLTFAAPIIYMKKSLSFINAYNSMKNLFLDNGGKNQGELKFFREFLNKTINVEQNVTNEKGHRINESNLDNEISSDVFLSDETYSNLKKGLKNLIGDTKLMKFDDDEKKLSIKCFDIMDSFVKLRNKAFHDKIDYKNKANTEVLLDDIFEVMNDIYVNWIEYILNYSIKADYEMHQDLNNANS
ncbi:hypothetical protein [Lactiplantibacillus plantarum]|uniref:hypothetical protein n=1 Tax=Lactiplantibacillus plantarum TaxID=1590 RepID=UPI000760526E|nr:hypothetical protein [Lactiplantibacillus plantarum]KWT47413.1 hypothetical protein ABB42_15145 [Lactiplantibacillus plantarum]